MTRRTTLLNDLAHRIAAAARRERRLVTRWQAAVLARGVNGPVAWRAGIAIAEIALAECRGRRAGLSVAAEMIRTRHTRKEVACN